MNGLYEGFIMTRADAISTLSNITNCLSQAIYDAAEDENPDAVCKYATVYTTAQAALLKLMREEMQELSDLQNKIDKTKEREETDHE